MNTHLPARAVFNSLLVAGAVAVAPHTLELPAWTIAVFAAALLWRYGIENFQWYRPQRAIRLLLMTLVVLAILRQFGTLLGRDAGIALVITMLGLKFLELKTQRDFIVCLFLFYLIVLGSFLYSQSLWLGVWALLTVTLITAALIHLIQPTNIDMKPRLRLSAIMLAKALPLMIVVYLLFPRVSGTLWGLPADAFSGITGMPDAIQPGSIRNLSQSSEIAFRVSFEGAPPPARELYWRGLVLTETDGRSWNRAAANAAKKASFLPLTDAVRYQLILEPSNKIWMPALDLPAMTPAQARYQSDFTLQYNEPIRERINYTLISYTRYNTGALSAADRLQALALPADRSPRARTLAEQWRRDSADSLQIARAALDYFHRENFIYTLNPPLLGDDPVDEFLFSARRGFCEHFATAFVTLMRAAGIPSRVVVGYQGGELNTAGNYLIVRQSDAHAWAEIWIAERGWVRMDPTGAVAPERIELGLDAVRRLEQQGVALGGLPGDAMLRALQFGWLEKTIRHAQWYWDWTNLTWYRWVVDYGKERQEKFLASIGLDDISWGRMLGLLLVGVVLVTLVYAVSLWRPKKSVDRTQQLYLRLCRKLARVGLVRAPHEAPLAFAQRCARRRPDIKERINIIFERYLRARYGQHNDALELRAFKRAVSAFKI